MSTSATSNDLTRRLDEAVALYGKLGLLIDDADDARSRAARAIYGCESLPSWWLIGRSLVCAIEILAWLHHRIESGATFPAIVILDRYLPASCQDSRRKVPWDVPPGGLNEDLREYCTQLRAAVERLLFAAGEHHPQLFVELETSYPHRLPPASCTLERPLSWKTRNPDLLYRLRNKIEKVRLREPMSLLSFGPGQGVGNQVADPRVCEQADWLSSIYWSTLQELADSLSANASGPVVLLTGAGASFGASRLGRGVARTDLLLEEACRHVLGTGKSENRVKPIRPQCGCSALAPWEIAERHEPKRQPTNSQQTPLEWMIGEFRQGTPISRISWQLEEVFSTKDRHGKGVDPQTLQAFREGFRAALHHHDHGFLYHHWLLAQLPWTQIITTNFDSFHERAAVAAATSKATRQRRKILRLGNRFPAEIEDWHTEVSDRDRRELLQWSRLFKPYGSLLAPLPVRLAAEELLHAKERFKRTLGTFLTPDVEGTLVVLGHSVRDHFLNEVLKELQGNADNETFLQRIRLIWVDPVAFDRAQHARPGIGPVTLQWDLWMRQMLACRQAGPFPVNAHEFVYDLWRVYVEATQI